MTSATKSVNEGTVFVVPLPSGGAARGVVARLRNTKRLTKTQVAVGYFFGPRVEEATSALLQPSQAVLVCRFGVGALLRGEWKTLGVVPNFERDGWPTPIFRRVGLTSGKAIDVVYADDDPLQVVQEREADMSTDFVVQDGLLSSRGVEAFLDDKLDRIH